LFILRDYLPRIVRFWVFLLPDISVDAYIDKNTQIGIKREILAYPSRRTHIRWPQSHHWTNLW